MYNESLLEETLRVLKDSGVRPEDVQYVLTSEVWMTWEEFANAAKKVYDDRFCSTCKYFEDSVLTSPCSICIGFSNWKAKNFLTGRQK